MDKLTASLRFSYIVWSIDIIVPILAIDATREEITHLSNAPNTTGFETIWKFQTKYKSHYLQSNQSSATNNELSINKSPGCNILPRNTKNLFSDQHDKLKLLRATLYLDTSTQCGYEHWPEACNETVVHRHETQIVVSIALYLFLLTNVVKKKNLMSVSKVS